MGVTIHFEGKLINDSSLTTVISLARSLAGERGWQSQIINEDQVTLYRVKDEQDWDYIGPVSGIVLMPDPDCDPLRLEFDKDLYLQEYVKTQFAGPEIHITIVKFLKLIEQHFINLDVFDEGEYWETENTELLKSHLSACFEAMRDELAKNPRVSGPHRLEDERIVDLIEEDPTEVTT